MSNIEELKFDKKNFNKHTPEGMGLLEKSLRQFGAGRSILVDKDNNIIAGNGIVEAAQNAGITKTRVIETTGDELVVVKRKDVELDSHQGREMALADNATAQADLAWDEGLLEEAREKLGINTEDWGVEILGFDLDKTVDTASLGTIAEFSDDTDYNLKNLYREKVAKELTSRIKEGEESGKIRPEIADILRTRASQCSIFNFDEIIKFYRSGDASEEEKELLRKLYLVFITPKEALEAGMLEMERITGEIYSNNLTERLDNEN